MILKLHKCISTLTRHASSNYFHLTMLSELHMWHRQECDSSRGLFEGSKRSTEQHDGHCTMNGQLSVSCSLATRYAICAVSPHWTQRPTATDTVPQLISAKQYNVYIISSTNFMFATPLKIPNIKLIKKYSTATQRSTTKTRILPDDDIITHVEARLTGEML